MRRSKEQSEAAVRLKELQKEHSSLSERFTALSSHILEVDKKMSPATGGRALYSLLIEIAVTPPLYLHG